MADDTLKLRLPNAAKLEQIREAIQEDEDWRFGRLKLDGKKPRFELPTPTKDDPDNVEIAKDFCGVVVVAKKNFYQSEEDKTNNVAPKEKRALYILRTGKYMPELMYVSPSALRNWLGFAKEVVQNQLQYFDVMISFTAEQVKSKNTGFVWSKPKFAISRVLTEAEKAHIATLREWVLGKVQDYEDTAKLAEYEDQALSVDRSSFDFVEEVEADTTALSKKTSALVEEDEAPAAPVAAKSKKTKEEDAPVAAKEEEVPKAGYPSLDEAEDDPDDLAAISAKKSSAIEDEED